MQFRGAAALCISDHIRTHNSPENGSRLTPVRFVLGDGQYLYDKQVNFDTHFETSDLDIEQRLNHALSYFATKKTGGYTDLPRVPHFKSMCTQKEKRLPNPAKKLIIKTRPIPHIIDQRSFEEPIIIRKGRSPSELKKFNISTTGRKNSVRFVDSVGLDFGYVKRLENKAYIIEDHDEFDDAQPLLKDRMNSSKAASTKVAEKSEHSLSKCFVRSKGDADRLTDVQNVCIKSISCTKMFVSGTIQVKNIAFEKQVRLRYTLDGWQSYAEIQCPFTFSDAHSYDTFCFSLCLPLDLPVGSCCEMCVLYSTAGQDFWDNNSGEDYKLDCRSSSSTESD